MSPTTISGVSIPDSALAREVTQLIRDTESEMLFLHSTRVYFWAGLTGNRKGLKFDPELLYTAAMFHDVGLTDRYRQSQLRFEVDGANAAGDFLRSHGISDAEIETVWTAIALHTTPGVPELMRAEVALVHAAAGMDVVGRAYEQFSDEERKAVVAAYPRGHDFEQGIIDAFYQGLKHRPDSTFGTFNDDYLACNDPQFQRVDLCSVILSSDWTRGGAINTTSSKRRTQ